MGLGFVCIRRKDKKDANKRRTMIQKRGREREKNHTDPTQLHRVLVNHKITNNNNN